MNPLLLLFVFLGLTSSVWSAPQATQDPLDVDDNASVEDDEKNGMCPDHDPSIRGMKWSEVQEKVFGNRFLHGANCDMGEPGEKMSWCEEEFTGLSAQTRERKRQERRTKYENYCNGGKEEYEANNYQACCIRRIKSSNGSLVLAGVNGNASLPCFHENKNRSCRDVEWDDRRAMICSVVQSKTSLPSCLLDTDCAAGTSCCWRLEDNKLVADCEPDNAVVEGV